MKDPAIDIGTGGSKGEKYAALVADRKQCFKCQDVVNPSSCASGRFDSGVHIGPWSDWQGNLDAEIMVVGQEWGGTDDYDSKHGRDTYTYRDKTNQNLVHLITNILGRDLPIPSALQGTSASGEFFFTNAALCLKEGTATGGEPISPESFAQCGRSFLRRQVELIEPHTIFVLGQRAWEGLMGAYGRSFGRVHRDAVDGRPEKLSEETTAVPLYHCGGNGLRTRKLPEQESDWIRAAAALNLI
jgi:uracil-DNA glycosylase